MPTQLPGFLIKRTPKLANRRRIRQLLGDSQLHTVCEAASCPNIGECFARQTCTFMILGERCTRCCAFCGVTKGEPFPPDPTEPARIAAAVKKLGLQYIVITAVTRDDLPDGGAGQFAAVATQLHQIRPAVQVEFLVPDFQGKAAALDLVLAARPQVLNHNLETVPRLYPQIRPAADYHRSLLLLERAKKSGQVVYTKSGFMVGLGEEPGEVVELLCNLKSVGCDLVTIGQYLPPSRSNVPVTRYLPPEEFDSFKKVGERLGLKIFAGPFVRSSYHAKDVYEKI